MNLVGFTRGALLAGDAPSSRNAARRPTGSGSAIPFIDDAVSGAGVRRRAQSIFRDAVEEATLALLCSCRRRIARKKKRAAGQNPKRRVFV